MKLALDQYVEFCMFIFAKLSSSWLVKWLVELILALSSIITTPTHHIASATNPPHSLRNQPPPPG